MAKPIFLSNMPEFNFDLSKHIRYGIGNDIEYDDNGNCIVLIKYLDNTIKILIDEESKEDVRRYTFHYNPKDGYCYAYNPITKKKVALHKVILNYFDNEYCIDHINHNKLDNRKCNLRLVTKSFNCHNRKSYINGHKGVYYHKRDNVYRVSLCIKGAKIYKTFKDYPTACKYANEIIKKYNLE